MSQAIRSVSVEDVTIDVTSIRLLCLWLNYELSGVKSPLSFVLSVCAWIQSVLCRVGCHPTLTVAQLVGLCLLGVQHIWDALVCLWE